MVTSLGTAIGGNDPLTAFIADEGLVRFCTENYSKPTVENKEDLLSHLTNYSLNKLSENYVHVEDMAKQEESSKRTLTSVFEELKS